MGVALYDCTADMCLSQITSWTELDHKHKSLEWN